MALLQEWQQIAYNTEADQKELKRFWDRYFEKETAVYESLLTNPDEAVTGTVQELADRYGIELMAMVGFLDGINESLVTPNPIEEMEADTVVSLEFDNEKLFRNMVDAKAPWLYGLPQWDDIYDKETQEKLIRDQRASHTIVKEKKIYPNDPCPCGSGKKYKKCCGRGK